MNESLVLSRDPSQKLVEAGVWIEAEFWWIQSEWSGTWVLVPKDDRLKYKRLSEYPAPLTDELLRVMPPEIGGRWLSLYPAIRDTVQYFASYAGEDAKQTIMANDTEDTPSEALGSLILVPEVLAVVKKNMKEGE